MRKRSDVKAPAAERTMPMFEDKAEVAGHTTRLDKETEPGAFGDYQEHHEQMRGVKSAFDEMAGDDPPEVPPKSAFRIPKCGTCNELLTASSGGFYAKCGHRQPGPGTVNAKSETQTHPDGAMEFLSPGTVLVTWGEEKFTPIANSYSTFTVGPFSTTVTRLPNEHATQAWKRGYDTLVELAEKERDRKATSFVRALKGMKEAAK